METYIHKENLMLALKMAIVAQSEKDKKLDYDSESAFVAGLRKVLADMQAGKRLIVKSQD